MNVVSVCPCHGVQKVRYLNDLDMRVENDSGIGWGYYYMVEWEDDE